MAKGLEIRPASAADVRQFYDKPFWATLRAYIATIDGEPAGIMGIAYTSTSIQAFSEMKPVAVGNHLAVSLCAWAMIKLLKNINVSVIAIDQHIYEGSAKLLRKCGFEFHHESNAGDVYIWPSRSRS